MADPDELLDIKEAARFLRVSETSLRRWTNSGALPNLRIGRRRERRFRRSELLAFLEGPPGSSPAVRSGSADAAGSGFAFVGHPAGRGTHLCGLFTSEAARVAQAARFLEQGLRAGSVCLLVVTAPKPRRAILAELARRLPSLGSDAKAGRLQVSAHAASRRAQIQYFETEIGKALEAGAPSVHVLSDGSEGGPELGRPFARVVKFECELQRWVARHGPVVALCQYDARRLSGIDLHATLQCHPDVLGGPVGMLV